MGILSVKNSLSLLVIIGIVTLQSCATQKPIRKSNKSITAVKKTQRTPKADSSRDRIIDVANKYIGTKYVYGGKDGRGFDCSGFVTRVFFENKIDIRGSSSSLSKQGKGKTIQDARMGDLVFFKKGERVNHVALISEISKNELWVIHSTSSRGVIKENIMASPYWSTKKYFIKDLL